MEKVKWTNKQLEKMTEKELEALYLAGRLSVKRYVKEEKRRTCFKYRLKYPKKSRKWTNKELEQMNSEELYSLYSIGRISKERYNKSERKPRNREFVDWWNSKNHDTSDPFFWENFCRVHGSGLTDKNDLNEYGYIKGSAYKNGIMMSALKKLTEKQQLVLKLKFGLTEEFKEPLEATDIATVLGCSTSNVHKIQRAAYIRISRLIQNEGRIDFFKDEK